MLSTYPEYTNSWFTIRITRKDDGVTLANSTGLTVTSDGLVYGIPRNHGPYPTPDTTYIVEVEDLRSGDKDSIEMTIAGILEEF